MILSEKLCHSQAASNSFHLQFQFSMSYETELKSCVRKSVRQNMDEKVKLNYHSNECSSTVITEKATCTEISEMSITVTYPVSGYKSRQSTSLSHEML